MPRRARYCPDGVVQHILNRGNHRKRIFRSSKDYLGFLAAMTEAGERTFMRLIAYCLIPNHFHLVLWPDVGRDISRYMHVMMNEHLRDIQPRHGLAGLGHRYQGRYKNFPVMSEGHFLNVCRYVEANALNAGLCARAEDWEWCSLSRSGPEEGINLLAEWPIPKPRNWLEQVNRRNLPFPVPEPWLPPSHSARGASGRGDFAPNPTQTTEPSYPRHRLGKSWLPVPSATSNSSSSSPSSV